MRKLLLTVLIVLVAGLVHAEVTPLDISDQLQKLPNLKQGIVYSMETEQWLPMTSATVMEMPFMEKFVKLDLGYVGPDKLVVAMSLELFNLKDWLNISMPILDSIVVKPTVYYGWEKLFNNASDDDWGIGSSVIEFRF